MRPSAEEDELIDYYERKGKYQLPHGYGTSMTRNMELQSTPEVPRPGIFQPDPFVVGPPEMARAAQRLMDRSPKVKQNVSGIIAGLSSTRMRDMLNQMNEAEDMGRPAIAVKPEDYRYSNILGEYGLGKAKDISINPRFFVEDTGDYDWLDTLKHELAHAAGWEDSDDPNQGANKPKRFAPASKLDYLRY